MRKTERPTNKQMPLFFRCTKSSVTDRLENKDKEFKVRMKLPKRKQKSEHSFSGGESEGSRGIATNGSLVANYVWPNNEQIRRAFCRREQRK